MDTATGWANSAKTETGCQKEISSGSGNGGSWDSVTGAYCARFPTKPHSKDLQEGQAS